jgi:putative transcriptional regulator
VRFSTLSALCRELDCQPGDLMGFEPGPADEDDGDFEDG